MQGIDAVPSVDIIPEMDDRASGPCGDVDEIDRHRIDELDLGVLAGRDDRLDLAARPAGRAAQQPALRRVLHKVGSAADLEASLANVRKTTDGVEAGEGALGALLKDQELEEQLRSIVASVNKVTGELEAGRGTLGKLITNEEVFDNVRKISEDLAAVTEKVRSGEGTLGRIR